ncbi:hypothetical protein [Nocardia abscessus]|nr:hypothetical protein [Nocardia abscessus]
MNLAEECDDIPQTGNPIADAIIVIASLALIAWWRGCSSGKRHDHA